MSSTLHSFLPPPPVYKDVILQARVTPDVAAKVKSIAAAYHWSPSDVIRAGLNKFFEERDEMKPEEIPPPTAKPANPKPTQTSFLERINLESTANKSAWK